MMYQSGECVIYGIHGVCRVIGLEKQLINRKRTEYLVLEPLGSGESRFYVPTSSDLAMAKLRPVLEKEALINLMESDEIHNSEWIADESARKNCFRELIGSGDRTALLKMVCMLYQYKERQLAAGKKFHQCDDNFLRDAEKLLSSEICYVMSVSPEEAKKFLREKLQTQ